MKTRRISLGGAAARASGAPPVAPPAAGAPPTPGPAAAEPVRAQLPGPMALPMPAPPPAPAAREPDHHFNVRIPMSLWDQVRAFADRYARKGSINAFVLDAIRYYMAAIQRGDIDPRG